MIQSAAKMKIFRRFMRTNAPAALRQVWTDARIQLGLSAIGSFVVQPSGANGGQDELFTMPWREIDSALPKATITVIESFFDGFAEIHSGSCRNPPCDGNVRSTVPFKISRGDPLGDSCACCHQLFDDDRENAINDILVVPRSTSGNTAGQALVFCSPFLLAADETRFLHTSSGLYFAQQTIWESGQREEPVAALRPREIECVRWAVTGKTLVEIAEVMGLSYRTVRFHLDSARARYGFSTNQQLFVQAAKDYGLDPDSAQDIIRRNKNRLAGQTIGRIQPLWAERRDARDRRGGERRQTSLTPLPFPDRRAPMDRRGSRERRTIVDTTPQSTDHLLTPEEIRALLN